MKVLKPFGEYLRERIAQRGVVDNNRAQSLLLEAERKWENLHKNVQKVGVDAGNANDYVEYCYDILLFLIRAALYKKGYSCSGLGAHEAEIAFARNLRCSEQEVQFLDELRFFRNGILYYGKRFDAEYAQKVIAFTLKNYGKLKEIALK